VTRRQLERIVRQWTRRLGLERWDVTLCWDEWDEEKQAHAYIWRSRDYDRAALYLNPAERLTWSELDAHRYVVHELLHLATREAESVLDLVKERLHPDAHAILEEAHRHELEGIVDRLAYRLVELAGVT